VSENQSNEKRRDDDDAWELEGMPAYAYACGACVRAKVDDGKSQKT
jgi:hypothetical protein